MSEYAITTDSLTKVYSETRAVDRVNLHVPKGSIYAFLGRSGAGKTTTIRMLMGLTRPTSGSASIFGMGWPRDGIAILERTGYLPEKKLLFDSMTGHDLVRFNRSFFAKWSSELTAKYVREFEIPMDRAFKKLSLGNQTKLCLLMALSQGAELLILDEPTTGLDPVVMDELLKALIEDYASEGGTIFLSSHILAEVEKVADWVGVVDHGKLLLEADLEDIRADWRRVTASGSALPAERTSQVVSVRTSGATCEYHVRSNADRFVAELRNQGATIVDVSTLSLEQVFLQLVRKEEPCTSGNAGTIRAVASTLT